ncbi:hypothetical protein [Allocoleopsis franciscana]|uniref:Lipopolysaccharide biosynthesis protein n=1 Tax=Allocoleopsis franciscana PCC 7113 TaxID=1173027 RepID=K9WMY0_9CYAN|nr:hypothetical protein [Allocoleopsis franciscana]AFZ20912.1 hypothetical protein Mic7113_5263 [Allocoleopsis franciscana PCC 7113]
MDSLHTKEYQETQDDEISLAEVKQFFRNNWKFIGLTTVVLSAIAIPLSLLKPQQYQKQLTLAVEPVPLTIAGQSLLQLDATQASNLAVKFLKNQKLDSISAQPQYDPIAQEIQLSLQSANASSLKEISPKIISQVETGFQTKLDQAIESRLTNIEQEQNKRRQVQTQLEQQITQFSPNNTARLNALEEQRAQVITNLALTEYDRKYLEQAHKELSKFTAKLISVQIVKESEVQPTRSLKQVAVIAVIGSFLLAVFAASTRHQILRLKKELSQQKPQSSPDV